MTAKQKEILTAFAKESGVYSEGNGEGLFEKVKNMFD
jgi:hypothetical protein